MQIALLGLQQPLRFPAEQELSLRWGQSAERFLLLRQGDGPQGFIIRDGIKMDPSLFKDGTLGKHGSQCVHLFGCVQIRPDTYLHWQRCW